MKTLLIFLSFLITVGANSQSITNTLGIGGLFTIKDSSNDYLILNQSTGQVSVLSSLSLENTTNSNLGVLFKGPDRFLHNYGTDNTFLGINSGNFTMTSFGRNTAMGYKTLYLNTTGFSNTAMGWNTLYKNTSGEGNTAVGNQCLYSNTDGYYNVAVGYNSLFTNNNGFRNVAIGTESLYSNIDGSRNTAVGSSSLQFNTYGQDNTALGYYALFSNTGGNNNASVGSGSLYSNTSGFNNTAVGYHSSYYNTSGINNTAVGHQSLHSNDTGGYNTSLGVRSLHLLVYGNYNTAVGFQSLNHNTVGNFNSALGTNSLFLNSGNENTALGSHAGYEITTGNNVTCIGFDAQPITGSSSNQITLGNSSVTSLRCNVTTITSLSDARDKKNIKDLSLGLDFIMKIKPRLFNWDKREWYENNISDGSNMNESPTAGFIAQELDEVQTTENAEWLNLVLKDNPEKLEATSGNLLPVMVKAIQELKEENEMLKKRLLKFEQLLNEFASNKYTFVGESK